MKGTEASQLPRHIAYFVFALEKREKRAHGCALLDIAQNIVADCLFALLARKLALKLVQLRSGELRLRVGIGICLPTSIRDLLHFQLLIAGAITGREGYIADRGER